MHRSSSSFSSLSLAFPDLANGKRSPRQQATECLVHASTANSLDDYILQPKATSGHLDGLFTADERKRPEKDEEKKIKQLTQRLSRIGITNLQEPHIQYALNANYSNGDQEKAFSLLVLFQESLDGIIRDYNPDLKLLGAVNREGVTCYLDALLFAMFARLASFEAMLYNTFADDPRKRLATVLRLWVNMLRTGKLITTDIVITQIVIPNPMAAILMKFLSQTQHLQEALSACGWTDAAELKQQDTSEAFTFITEKLELPLLTLKMDIFHTGKEDADDDHKFVNERLLEVAIPQDDPGGEPITLEDCLETYFNNRIEVKRHLERRSTMTSVRSRRSIDSAKAHAFHIETVDLDSPSSSPASSMLQNAAVTSSPVRSTNTRHRAPSIIQERVIQEGGEPSESSPRGGGVSQSSSRRKGSIVRKEVLMPAWQFFSLIPWYTDNTPTNDAQVAAHFSSKRPVLGLCLKRYSFLPNGTAVRRNTYIDIPLEIGLPHFIQDDKMEDDGPIFGNFKLSLQSVVCHRGVSVDSGHYISLVRGTASNAQSPNSTAGSGPAVLDQKSEDRWMRFDDLAEERISYINIEQALREESPYLLFYQVQPIDDTTPGPVPSENPPSYSEFESKDLGLAGPSLQSDMSQSSHDNVGENGRFSLDGTDSEDPPGRSSVSSDRRASVTFTDGSGRGLRPDQIPIIPVTPNDEDGGGSWRISRRGSKVGKAGSKSRPTSQSGETRLSATFSRLALRISKDKLWAPNGNVDGADEAAVIVDADALPKVDGTDRKKLKRQKKDK
ncbi:MAG: hypothetical protein M1830_004388, partial [Pleopsidium flavum]